MTLNQCKNYDAFGRVIATEHLYAQGATSGNPISTTHQDRWTNTFDDQGRLNTTTSPTGFINTQYDDFGRKKATQSGTTGSTVLSEVTYAYDALSRLSTVLTVRRDGLPVDTNATQNGNQPEATRYHFDLLGRPDYTELPNGVVEDYVFDNMDRLDLMQHFQSDSNNADLTDNALKNMFDYSYRADGKRVGLVERFDTSGTGIRAGSSTLTNNYTWTYDDAGRLVSELLDSSDDSLDQAEAFLMDLVGNRIRRMLDKPGTAKDTTDIYTYDSSDRILSELRYSGLFATSNPTGSPTQTTTYAWNATQQSSKTVSVPSVSFVVQSMSYGLSGQLERVTTTTQDGNGQITDRMQVEYRYDPQGIRFIANDYAYNLQTSGFTLQDSTEYLIDHANFTGYQQTIIETAKNAAGQTTKRITYTYGLDEITQTTTTLDPNTGAPTISTTHTFAHDGRGSTRVLFEAAAVIAQIYTYSAYGELLAIHNTLGTAQSVTSPITTLLYNGESLDSNTGLYNFRARWYSAGSGRFERLDPFAGNPEDPFSFNKYGFVHGDPILGIDPTGNEFTIGGLLGGLGIGGNLRAQNQGAQLTGKQIAKKTVKELFEELRDTFNFKEPTDPWQKKLARSGEKLWLKRLIGLGFVGFGMQASSVGTHGPDLVAVKLTPAGRVQVVIGEIKALSSSKVLAALDETIDGHLQMSINWLRGHAELVADMLISAINMALNTALTSANLGGAATWVKNALDRGEIDLYLLRARYYGSDDWKLQGYKLLNLRTKGSGVKSFSDVQKSPLDATDPLQERYPQAKGTYAKQSVQ